MPQLSDHPCLTPREMSPREMLQREMLPRKMLPCHQPPPRNPRRGMAGHLLQLLRKYLIKYNLFLYQILKSSFYFIKINGFRCTLINKFTLINKAAEEKEGTERKHAEHVLEIKKSMAAMAMKYGEKRKPKKRKYDTSSEDSSSEASGEVSLWSHSDKKRKKKEKR